MIFLNLMVDNFGVFNGKHSFDLAPRLINDQNHNLTIFSGHNGAGKTTLFQAMMVALHGFSQPVSSTDLQKDKDFMRSRIHGYRSIGSAKDTHIVDSGVALSFQYVKSGKTFTVEVERRWKKHGQGVREILHVLQDGQPPKIDADDYQAWLDELIPPGFAQLCFFDAEQLDALANRGQQSAILRETLMRLLGLDWVQRLDADLEILMNRQGSTKKVESLYTKVLELQTARDKVDDHLGVLRRELEEVNSDISSCETALAQQDRLLAAEGGLYAARRPALQEKLNIVQKEVDTLSNQLRDLCGELLPFALAPELCLQLYKRLVTEIELRRQHTLNALLQDKLPEIESLLAEDGVWEGLNISLESRKHVARQLAEKLKTFGQPQSINDETIVHHLSEPEHQQLRSWIAQAIRDIPQQVQLLGTKLRTVKEETRCIELDLQRAPDDDVLAPLRAEITRLQKILNEKKKRLSALEGQIGSLQFQRDEKQRDLQEIIEQYSKLRKLEKQLKYAERSKAIMRAYKDVLTRQKLQDLERALVISFNKICRKEHLLSQARISPEYFEIHLETVENTPLRLSDFSAGERQLYAMALLWALRMVSKLSLPLAIDTPLARLDQMHRSRLMDDYVPFVSEQVLLFSTDAELDAHLLTEAKYEIAHIYRLRYDSEEGGTSVTSDDIDLYKHRGLSLSVAEEMATYGI